MLQKKLCNIFIKFTGNTIIGFIFLVYFFISSSIIFITSTGSKMICDRLEPGYVLCEKDELRIDRLVKREKTNFRLIDVVIKNAKSKTIYKIEDINKKTLFPKGEYSIYLNTNQELILYDTHDYMISARGKSEIIDNYIYSHPNPESYRLNIRNNILEMYLQNKNDQIINLIVLLIGWIILIIGVRPIFRKVNLLK